MVPVERVESTQNSPASTQMLIGVLEEATNIGANLIRVSSNHLSEENANAHHRYLEERYELKEMAD